MTPPLPPRLYRLLRSGATDTPRSAVALVVAAALLLTFALMVRVARHHEVRQLGYRLSKAQRRLTEQREVQRTLELERATLVAPERVRKLAAQLGMAPVPADRIRAVAEVGGAGGAGGAGEMSGAAASEVATGGTP
jgi:cell division protein FtsL